MADFGLADPVNAAESLLDAVRVPRQVVIDHQVRALEIDALAGSIGRQQHLNDGVVLERFLSLGPLLPPHSTVNDDDGVLTAQQRGDALFEIVHGVPVLGEDHELLRWRRSYSRGRGSHRGRRLSSGGNLW